MSVRPPHCERHFLAHRLTGREFARLAVRRYQFRQVRRSLRAAHRAGREDQPHAFHALKHMMESMPRQTLVGWPPSAALAIVPAYLRTAQTVPPSIGDARQEDAVALRILFGEQRIHPKTWDGEIAIDRGSVVRLTGVFFEHKDEITGTRAWKFTSRATNYMDSRSPRGYDPVHTSRGN